MRAQSELGATISLKELNDSFPRASRRTAGFHCFNRPGDRASLSRLDMMPLQPSLGKDNVKVGGKIFVQGNAPGRLRSGLTSRALRFSIGSRRESRLSRSGRSKAQSTPTLRHGCLRRLLSHSATALSDEAAESNRG